MDVQSGSWQDSIKGKGWIIPEWPAPDNVRSVCTTRKSGVSLAPFNSLNLGDHVSDDSDVVLQNRQILRDTLQLATEPLWLEQVHGVEVFQPDLNTTVSGVKKSGVPKADASVVFDKGQASVVMTADCLPVLFCDRAGTRVAAAHAGWRGLCHGVLEQTVQRMDCAPFEIMAWLGPAIGPNSFEVGVEVRDAFIQHDAQASKAFKSSGQEGKFLADIYLLARQRLQAVGIEQVYGGNFCTVTDSERFFSYRRKARTGRMAALVWLV